MGFWGIVGNVGIIGLYITILLTVGGIIRNFLLPQVSTIMLASRRSVTRRYTSIPDADLLLDLIHSLYICRFSNYSFRMDVKMTIRGHYKDEKRIFELLIRIFRSPELLVKLTESPASYHCVKRVLLEE